MLLSLHLLTMPLSLFPRPFKPLTIRQRWSPQLGLFAPVQCACFTTFFRFGNRGLDLQNAGIYGSRDDFDRDDVEQYFNYMGMLATEGSYDKVEALLNKGIHPVDILLLLVATKGDKPKIEELICASADYTIYDVEGRTALDRDEDEEIR